jgi:hypothetical protein
MWGMAMGTNCFYCGIVLDTVSLQIDNGQGVCWSCHEQADLLHERLIAMLFSTPER